MTMTITISVPDDLYKKVKSNSEIKISKVCQNALFEAIEKLELGEVDPLAHFGAERLRKARVNQWGVLIEKSFTEGRKWVANVASLEELVWVFEEGELIEGGWIIHSEDIPEEVKKLSEPNETWLLNSDTFGSIAFNFIDPEILENDPDNELFWSFADGAKSMWREIKLVLKS